MKRLNFEVWQKFWRLVVLWEKEKRWAYMYWKCKCDCWKEIWAYSSHLYRWKKLSCWCLLADCVREKQKKNCYKNWLRIWKNRFSRIYQWIRRRCKNPNDKAYPNYWWRWIKIQWNNLEEFYNDMYPSYIEHLEKYWEMDTTIDRIDNNWDYCKENCKRSTRKEQNNNRRDNSYVEINWIKYSTHQFAKEFNLKYDTAKYRMRLYRKWKMPYKTLIKKWKWKW